MLFDKTLRFFDNKAITASTNSNVVYVGSVDASFGNVEIPLHAIVTETFAGATALEVELKSAATEDMADATVIWAKEFDGDDLVQGAVIGPKYLPKGSKNYLRMDLTVTGTVTAGKVNVGVVNAHDENPADLFAE